MRNLLALQLLYAYLCVFRISGALQFPRWRDSGQEESSPRRRWWDVPQAEKQTFWRGWFSRRSLTTPWLPIRSSGSSEIMEHELFWLWTVWRQGEDKLLDNYLFSLPILFLRDLGKDYPVKVTGDAETLKWLKSQACEGMRVESRLNRSDISSSDKGECLMDNVLHGFNCNIILSTKDVRALPLCHVTSF